MKKPASKFAILTIAFLFLLQMIPQVAYADTEGSYSYTISASGATITRYNGQESNVTIPSTLGGAKVTAIGNGAFSGFASLASVTIPNSVASIGEAAFYGCTSLTSVTIPNGVTSIGKWSFSSCSNLVSVSIPDSVNQIGDMAFQYCTSLASVSIPNGVTSIGGFTFHDCTNLASVSIPGSVTSIGDHAFMYDSNLTSVIIPNNVTGIGDAAFLRCTSLTSAKFYGNAPTMGEDVFSQCSTNFKVYYLAGRTGFANPWHGYPTEPFEEAAYTVTYNENGGTGGSVPTDSKKYAPKSEVTVLGNTGSLVKTGYTFSGWNTKADGTGVSYTAGNTLSMGNANVALYAKWTINKYNVTFNSNGGSAVAGASVNYNSVVAEPAAPTKVGYTFGGWYKDTACINSWNFSTDKVTTDITLYAKWNASSTNNSSNSQSTLPKTGGMMDQMTLILAGIILTSLGGYLVRFSVRQKR